MKLYKELGAGSRGGVKRYNVDLGTVLRSLNVNRHGDLYMIVPMNVTQSEVYRCPRTCVEIISIRTQSVSHCVSLN